MLSREENYYRAIEFKGPETVPVTVSVMPATWAKYREAIEEIVIDFPGVFGQYEKGTRDFDRFEGTYQLGEYIDPWGCLWKNVAPGLDGVVIGHPLPNRKDVYDFKTPAVNTGLPHGFMFMRLYYLRGYEELMLDFAEDAPELQILIDKVLDHNLNEIDVLVAAKPRMIKFGDDLGNQDNLPIHPDKWIRYLKPCYAKMFAKCHEAGVLVYLHSDGHILQIIDSLVDCGVDVLNPQVGANGIENLARLAKGKVAIDLDLDRQNLPFWTHEQIDEHIHEAVEKLTLPDGGLLLFAEFEPDVPIENMRAVCQALEKYRHHV